MLHLRVVGQEYLYNVILHTWKASGRIHEKLSFTPLRKNETLPWGRRGHSQDRLVFGSLFCLFSAVGNSE